MPQAVSSQVDPQPTTARPPSSRPRGSQRTKSLKTFLQSLNNSYPQVKRKVDRKPILPLLTKFLRNWLHKLWNHISFPCLKVTIKSFWNKSTTKCKECPVATNSRSTASSNFQKSYLQSLRWSKTMWTDSMRSWRKLYTREIATKLKLISYSKSIISKSRMLSLKKDKLCKWNSWITRL
jgi:hypothetical protein